MNPRADEQNVAIPTSALSDIRVLDLGMITAGAASSAVLADFGADVIKVESTAHPDMFRSWNQVASSGKSRNLNQSPPFHTVNRNKRSIGLDLKTDAGRDLFLRLAEVSDLVVENYRRGVLERLGLGYEELKARNPAIVLLSLTSQGTRGPESGYVSFGSTLDALGGLMSVTGYDDGDPVWSSNNVNYPDQLVSFIAPGAALAAIREARTTGHGTWIDLSQRESVTFAIGEQIASQTLEGDHLHRVGNQAPGRIQGAYETSEDDRWIALSIRDTDDEWQTLTRVIGADDKAHATAEGRRREHEHVDELIARWARRRPGEESAKLLQQAGIPAAVVRTSAEMLDDRQLEQLGFYQTVNGAAGEFRQRGFIGRLSESPGTITRPAPDLGEHTREVLTELLGLTDDELDRLFEAKAISD